LPSLKPLPPQTTPEDQWLSLVSHSLPPKAPLGRKSFFLPPKEKVYNNMEALIYHFKIVMGETDIPKGEHTFNISYVGYKSFSSTLIFQMDEIKKMDFNLPDDVLGLEAVVVTATRNAIPAFLSPIIVNRLDDRIFDRTQSISLAEGLHFSPGLRIENNCQNCGFTQLRMNGLEGPYTQILINSRPVFSALAGVYGLEMIPTNMVERVEIVRGGGSALYGGNAISGTAKSY
jgi:outer membrane receptor for ferrienterochelin and colicins